MIDFGGTEQPLILASNCLAGTNFVDRVEAAASAGFDGIGLSLPAYRQLVPTQTSPQEMLSVLEANGLRLIEVEAIIGFSAETTSNQGVLGEGLSYTTPDDLRDFWSIADLFGPHHLQVAGSFHTSQLEPRAAERFASLCDEAALHDVMLCLEFVPPSNVPDAVAALRVIADADRDNGRMTIDSWSHTRSNGDLDFIRSMPAERIGLLQLNDGTLEPEMDDFIEETVRRRRAPGDGEFNLAGLIEAILATGATPPVSVEVMSDELNGLPPTVVAHRLADGARALFR